MTDSTNAFGLSTVVLEVQKEALAADHVQLPTSRHEFAGANRADTQPEKAATLLKYFDSIKQRKLRMEHAFRLFSEEMLADRYEDGLLD